MLVRLGSWVRWQPSWWSALELGPFAQVLQNPYRAVDDWAQLLGGRQMGAVGGVTVDPMVTISGQW